MEGLTNLFSQISDFYFGKFKFLIIENIFSILDLNIEFIPSLLSFLIIIFYIFLFVHQFPLNKKWIVSIAFIL
jgi:hypothetical protein